MVNLSLFAPENKKLAAFVNAELSDTFHSMYVLQK